VRRFEHAFDVAQLEEDHQPNREDGVVGGANVGDVVIHLIGHEPEFLEDETLGNLDGAEMSALRRVPGEGVQPFARLRHELRGAIDDPAGDDIAVGFLAVNDDGLLGA